jgi:hypothetical protein
VILYSSSLLHLQALDIPKYRTQCMCTVGTVQYCLPVPLHLQLLRHIVIIHLETSYVGIVPDYSEDN